jgi:hypothetical protein
MTRLMTLFGALAGAIQFFSSDSHIQFPFSVGFSKQLAQTGFIDRVFKEEHAVERNDGDLFAIFRQQTRIVLNVDLFQFKRLLCSDATERCERIVAKVAARICIKSDDSHNDRHIIAVRQRVVNKTGISRP